MNWRRAFGGGTVTVTLAKSNPSDLAGPRLVLWTGGFDSTLGGAHRCTADLRN